MKQNKTQFFQNRAKNSDFEVKKILSGTTQVSYEEVAQNYVSTSVFA